MTLSWDNEQRTNIISLFVYLVGLDTAIILIFLFLFFVKSGRLGESGTERIALGDKEWPVTNWAADSSDDFYSGCRNDSNFP